jgi:hypothetical protein
VRLVYTGRQARAAELPEVECIIAAVVLVTPFFDEDARLRWLVGGDSHQVESLRFIFWCRRGITRSYELQRLKTHSRGTCSRMQRPVTALE